MHYLVSFQIQNISLKTPDIFYYSLLITSVHLLQRRDVLFMEPELEFCHFYNKCKQPDTFIEETDAIIYVFHVNLLLLL